MSGSIAVSGIRSPVSVVRDRWGVPHISAANQDDLFFAQGFVQAQDRLFQMDLWRRSAQGRLAEVLGANFIERDIMTRRIQYDGNVATDWASYGSDARAIGVAFVAGINAWIAIAVERLPEEFRLAGWRPELWKPDDLLNRTDAFVESGNALAEVLRARLVNVAGVRETEAWLPGPTEVPRGLDVATISYGAADALRRVGTPPFFVTLTSGQSSIVNHQSSISDASNAWVVGGRRSATGSPLLATDPHRAFDNPSLAYLVHLRAPGWNVAGATSPWLPGVAIGHNERVAWGMTARAGDVQDLFVERINRANPHQVEEDGRWIDTRRSADAISVKGRSQPFAFEHERTSRGPVLAVDRERHLAFTIRWTGSEPGTAARLAAPAIDRAQSSAEFRAALARWKMPAVDVLYADVDGAIGRRAAGLMPVRRGWNGTLPVPAWTGSFTWSATTTPPESHDRRSDYLISANGDVARTKRLEELMASRPHFAAADFEAWQQDITSWTAGQLVPLLSRLRASTPSVEAARVRLGAWDKRISVDSPTATLYVRWEHALVGALAAKTFGAALARDYTEFVANPPASVLERLRRQDDLLIDALIEAVKEEVNWGALHRVLFAHPLAVTETTRRSFNVGPFPIAGYSGTVMATFGRGAAADTGPSFRQILDVGDWDHSLVTNAPGESGSPVSPHFADLAVGWAAGEYFPLVYSDEAVKANAETTLTLVPR